MAATQQLILAVIAGLCGAALYVLLLFASWRVKLDRFKAHDSNNLLSLLRMAAHRGDEPKMEMAASMLSAMWTPEEPAVVKLRRLVKSAADLMEVPRGCEFHLHLDSEIDVEIVPRDAFAVLINLMHNAAHAACAVRPRQPVLVELTDERLLIRNAASDESIVALLRGPGATTRGGNGHGFGRRSAAASAEKLGWSVTVEPDGQFVLTTVSGFAPAGDAPEST